MYMVPIIMFSALFNVPKFFEFRIIDEKLMDHDPVSNSSVNLNQTRVGFQPTNLRLDEDYVFYYVNLGRLFVIGLLPLLALSLLNGAIYRYSKYSKSGHLHSGHIQTGVKGGLIFVSIIYKGLWLSKGACINDVMQF